VQGSIAAGWAPRTHASAVRGLGYGSLPRGSSNGASEYTEITSRKANLSVTQITRRTALEESSIAVEKHISQIAGHPAQLFFYEDYPIIEPGPIGAAFRSPPTPNREPLVCHKPPGCGKISRSINSNPTRGQACDSLSGQRPHPPDSLLKHLGEFMGDELSKLKTRLWIWLGALALTGSSIRECIVHRDAFHNRGLKASPSSPN
jgi:hypothetical protein